MRQRNRYFMKCRKSKSVGRRRYVRKTRTRSRIYTHTTVKQEAAKFGIPHIVVDVTFRRTVLLTVRPSHMDFSCRINGNLLTVRAVGLVVIPSSADNCVCRIGCTTFIIQRTSRQPLHTCSRNRFKTCRCHRPNQAVFCILCKCSRKYRTNNHQDQNNAPLHGTPPRRKDMGPKFQVYRM